MDIDLVIIQLHLSKRYFTWIRYAVSYWILYDEKYHFVVHKVKGRYWGDFEGFKQLSFSDKVKNMQHLLVITTETKTLWARSRLKPYVAWSWSCFLCHYAKNFTSLQSGPGEDAIHEDFRNRKRFEVG